MLLCFLHSKKQRQCVHFVGAEHFPLENVMLNIFQRKMFSKAKCYKCIWCKNVFDAKMYLMQWCIWCKNVFLQSKASHFVGAEHFAKQTVQQNKMLQMHLMLLCLVFFVLPAFSHFGLLNIFLWKMFSKAKCYKCIWCKNVFDAYILFCWTFSFGKCDAEHFTKSNVMLNIFQRKMFSIKYIFARKTWFCFPSENLVFTKSKTPKIKHLTQ